MFWLLLTMAGGICAGCFLGKGRAMSWIGKAISFTVCLMLFVMGVKIGGNDDILQNLATLGWQALVLALASMAGSIILASLLYRFISRRDGRRNRIPGREA